MSKARRIALAATLAIVIAGCSNDPEANGQTATAGHDTDSHHEAPVANSATTSSADTAATVAYKRSMEVMMTDAPPYTGDADVDFMQQMRVHHEAAITMSEAVLKYGSDAEARKLAEQVITEQRREIVEIDLWLSQQR